MDLDSLVEKKKVEWTNKIKTIETKLAEERKMHRKTKSMIALKDVEVWCQFLVSMMMQIAKLTQHAQYLKECNDDVKSGYEHQIENLKISTVMMSENLSRLQAKYSRWRSQLHSRNPHARDVGTCYT